MIKLKDIINESTILNLFEQAEQPDGKITKSGMGGRDKAILDWFQANKNKSLDALDKAGVGPGSMYNNMPLTGVAGGISSPQGQGLSVILANYTKYGPNFVPFDVKTGDPNNKIVNKKGQFEIVAEKVPIKFNGYQWVAVDPARGANSSWRADLYKPMDFDKGVSQLNAANQRQFPTNKQIVNITPTIVNADSLSRNDARTLVGNIKKNMGEAYNNVLVYGKIKNQLILWGNYTITKTSPTPATPDEITDNPVAQEPPLELGGDNFRSNSANLTNAAEIRRSISARLAAMANKGIPVPAGLGTITIQSGTDSMPAGNYPGNNAGLAQDRADTIQQILISLGIPSDQIVIDTTGVDGVPAGTTSWANNRGQLTTPQWIAAAAPARMVQVNFGLAQSGGGRTITKGKKAQAGTKTDFQDRSGTQYDKTKVSDTSNQQDGFIWRLTVNMIK